MVQVNTFAISLKNVCINGFDNRTRKQIKIYPSLNKINSFISDTLKLDIKKIVSVTNLRHRQQVLIAFSEERHVVDLENKIFRGIVFPESGVKVNGSRLDSPTLSATLTGAPF